MLLWAARERVASHACMYRSVDILGNARTPGLASGQEVPLNDAVVMDTGPETPPGPGGQFEHPPGVDSVFTS